MQLSAHFTLEECIASQTAARAGISNVPPPAVVDHLASTCHQMEAARDLLGHAVIVSCGYRSEQLNALVGGAKTSAHLQGWALDFICPGYGAPLNVAVFLYNKLRDEEGKPLFDQIIHEFGAWVHISFDPQRRGEALTAKHVAGKTAYISGLSAV